MSLFDWFADRRKTAPAVRNAQEVSEDDGLWSKCPECGLVVYRKDLAANASVCSGCGYHHRIFSEERIRLIVDEGSFEALDTELCPTDPLAFKDRRSYADRIRDTQRSTGLKDSVITGMCTVEGIPMALGVMDFRFMGGSMGSVVGEKLARLIETATAKRAPVLIVCASGGARMQEGMLSLMQMAKTSAALGRLSEARLPYISILTHPTMGGVSASYAVLGDVNIAEPGALIGFAGARVIKETTKQTLPPGFQTAEFLLQKGLIDQIVNRLDMRDRLRDLLSVMQVGKPPVIAPEEVA